MRAGDLGETWVRDRLWDRRTVSCKVGKDACRENWEIEKFRESNIFLYFFVPRVVSFSLALAG